MALILHIRHLIPSYAAFPLFFALLWNQARSEEHTSELQSLA